ncbi:FkbM family methyltransferase [Rhodanobacter sp. FDAARGOS 1247]|uniref:FkbM family methyltransferase n=1 Tax=Rhodanobacter sp. FDAARGOS 1247 TaxID=2778082 RepID=UPI00194ED60C|nr:FkbM family methyltransferase [Rhodanobacter sp. FDAARGOS 1247]QRP64722.1 FkbM family methyltransferase [Rhodanobacter sp. FDAARGOS 1247]
MRHIGQRFGIDIHRHRPESSEYGRLSRMLSCQNINLVFDVGANVGQFAKSLRRAGYKHRLVSFEPLSSAHRTLLHNSRKDLLWEVAPRCAIGDREEEIEIHVSGNSVSSSALNMLNEHMVAAPDSKYVGIEYASVSRLDDIAISYLKDDDAKFFLKIDTQGYEDRVLDGASNLLTDARGLHMELSFVALYDGQKLFDDLVQRLSSLGFAIWAIWPGLCDPRSGRMLQVDVTFFRR